MECVKPGFIYPSCATITFVLATILLVILWKKAKVTYNKFFVAILAISSAFVFAAQMITFPIASGTSDS